MNALYNAPIDADGRPLFLAVEPKDRSALRLERPAILQVACDGARFAIGVRDSFGSLSREIILDYLERASKSSGQMESKTSGAGLGLYLVANNVTEVIFNILPGTATEVVAIFDIQSPRQQLKHLGVYEETIGRASEPRDPTRPHLVSAPGAAVQPPGLGKIVPITLATAVALLLVAGFLLVWPFLQKPAKGSLEVVTEPEGAMVYVNGVRKGRASPKLLVKELDVATTYAITARLPGYEEAQEVVKVDQDEVMGVKLVLETQKARLKVNSSPGGAKVLVSGKATGLKTPALIERLEPGKEIALRLEKYGFEPTTDRVTPTSEETLNLQIKLTLASGFSTFSATSTPAGARLLVNDVDTGLKTPVSRHVLRAGQPYVLKLVQPGFVPWTYEVRPREGAHVQKKVELVEGGAVSISSNVRAQITIAKKVKQQLPLVKKMLPAGNYHVRLHRKELNVDHAFGINVKAGGNINRQVIFGFIATKTKDLRIKLDKRRTVLRIARLPGRHPVTLVNTKSGKTREEQVNVLARQTTYVE
jgi:hypothetical protein